MSRPSDPFTAVILAGQRSGGGDPLAVAAEVTHKALVPIGGRPLIAHVVAALRAVPGLRSLRIVIEPGVEAGLVEALADTRFETVAAADNIADSVVAGCGDIAGPVVVTTADNVLLTPGAVAQMLAAVAGGADVAFAMASEAAVKAAHPDGQRRFYRFRDAGYSNCNLYAFADGGRVAAAELFRSGGQFAKQPRRLIAAVGLVNVALLRMGWLTLAGAARRLSRRLRMRVAAVVIADGRHAIDVDNERTYAIAAGLLARRDAEA